jgi:hypothetical protein
MLALCWIGLFMGSYRERPFTWDRTLERFPRSAAIDEVHPRFRQIAIRRTGVDSRVTPGNQG